MWTDSLPVPTLQRPAIAHQHADRLAGLLKRMPKAELHLHLEGCLGPELAFALARRNRVELPFADEEQLRAAYRFGNLQSFLDLYYAVTRVLQTEQDFYDLAMSYLQSAAADNVVRAEIFIDPQAHTDRGVDIGVMFRGLFLARDDARALLNVDAEFIVCFLRHLDEASALETLERCRPYRDQLLGVGLDSSELGHPPAKFENAFAMASRLGLRRVAHAGEEGPPAYIRDCLTRLDVERIDHGVRCMEDAALVGELAARRMPLTVCPLSNVRLGVYPTMAEHPLPAMMQAGLVVTVNSDDPAYFGGSVNDNYLAVFEAHPSLGSWEAYTLAANSLLSSFAPVESKNRWMRALDCLFLEAHATVSS